MAALEDTTNVFLPLLFHYDNCPEHDTLRNLLLHLETHPLNTSQNYDYVHRTNKGDNFLADGFSFHPPDTVYITTELHLTHTDIPRSYCEGNAFGAVMEVTAVPSLSSIAIYHTPYSTQELAVFAYVPELNEFEFEEYSYHLLFGSRKAHEMQGLAIAAVYSQTSVSLLGITEDILVLRNGMAPLHIHAATEASKTFLMELNKVLWLEAAARNCSNVTETLNSIVIVSDKPLAVNTAKVECENSLQFSFSGRVIHQLPSVENWGTNFIGDTAAFENLTYCIITLHLLSARDTSIDLVWYYHRRNGSFIENITLHANTALPVSNNLSDITHFIIDSYSQEKLLVIYEVQCYSNISGQMELYSSVLLQPVEWFSSVQSVYHYLPTIEMQRQEQHISLSISKQDFNITEIELVAKGNALSSTEEYIFYPLSTFEDHYTTFETESFYLLHLVITTAEFGTLHSLRHSNSCARMGVSTFSYGDTPQTRMSYSNGYFEGEKRVTSKDIEWLDIAVNVLLSTLCRIYFFAVSASFKSTTNYMTVCTCFSRSIV